MSEKYIKYNMLNNNKNSVGEKIMCLFNVINNIHNITNNISKDIWDGDVASKFQETSLRLEEFAKNKILDFKNTNDYKDLVSDSFQELEGLLTSNYL